MILGYSEKGWRVEMRKGKEKKERGGEIVGNLEQMKIVGKKELLLILFFLSI